MKLEDPELAHHLTLKHPLDRVRDWFSGVRSGESYYGLLQGNGDGSSTNLPIEESRRSPFSRLSTSSRPSRSKAFFWLLVPSYIARIFGHATANSTIPAPNKTSYLNGLRGIASLIVALQHTIDGDYPLIHRAWGDGEESVYVVQLPFVRLIHSGVFMVSVFFVISGFALTYGPLSKSYTLQTSQGAQGANPISSFPSSIFRRPFRLFLPTIPIIAVSTALIPFGAFYALNSTEAMDPVAVGFWGHVYYVWTTLVTIITSGSANTVMPQAWTLAAEYQGSLLVFLTCMAFIRMSPTIRLPATFLLLIYSFNLQRMANCMFISGMFIADFRHFRANLPELPRMVRLVVTVTSWLLLVPIIFLGCWPMHGDATQAPIYSWFIGFNTFGFGVQSFFQGTCAIALVLVLENLPVLQRVLNTKPALYLGEVSFSFYLIHWGCGKNFLSYGLKLKMLAAGYSLIVSWSTLFVIAMLSIMLLGDLHWRLVDQKSVQFSHWLAKRLGVS
ncbi:acyltransferase family-domain-containing protein [Colletotrichum godetiae]|uniref:Acyltransferase family-domain-containing protein n=1 Tax=Colletotrichum godetiae TaxID=1209918 RepID=A0AAJ0EMW6_9PEZI|nr:acyltransferase family-domain-containing protein [Colletotrichum godetiae]KAK1657931.1 acyltransferase family-domain-containing protein [Colletotrichum godetiae]